MGSWVDTAPLELIQTWDRLPENTVISSAQVQLWSGTVTLHCHHHQLLSHLVTGPRHFDNFVKYCSDPGCVIVSMISKLIRIFSVTVNWSTKMRNHEFSTFTVKTVDQFETEITMDVKCCQEYQVIMMSVLECGECFSGVWYLWIAAGHHTAGSFMTNISLPDIKPETQQLVLSVIVIVYTMKWDSVRAVSNIWFLSEVLFQLISITGEILTMLDLLVLLWSVKDCFDIYFSRFQPSDRLQFMPMKLLK